MNIVTWEMSNGLLVITYVLVGRELFTLHRGQFMPTVQYVTHVDAATAHAHAVRLTEGNEINGFTMRGGIWTCDVEVPISKIETLIHQRRDGKAAQALDPIIKAARIMGKEYR